MAEIRIVRGSNRYRNEDQEGQILKKLEPERVRERESVPPRRVRGDAV